MEVVCLDDWCTYPRPVDGKGRSTKGRVEFNFTFLIFFVLYRFASPCQKKNCGSRSTPLSKALDQKVTSTLGLN